MFWGTQSVFERVRGVDDTAAGYAARPPRRSGDDRDDRPRRIRRGDLRSSSKITYRQLLRIFFSVAHDPAAQPAGAIVQTSLPPQLTTRSGLLFIAQLDAAHVFGKPIVTEVTPLKVSIAPRSTTRITPAIRTIPTSGLRPAPRYVEALRRVPELFVEYKEKVRAIGPTYRIQSSHNTANSGLAARATNTFEGCPTMIS